MFALIRRFGPYVLAAVFGLMLAAHSVESREGSGPAPAGSVIVQEIPPEPIEAPAPPEPTERGRR